MSKVVNTTGIVDTTYLLSQTPKNEVPENYYLRTTQQYIDAMWRYRPNRVDVEEETEWGESVYSPLEVVIQAVRNDSGTKVSDDWYRLVFKDIFRKCRIGQRFRFSFDFDLHQPDAQKSVWLAVNQTSSAPTASQVINRCNGTIGSIWTREDGTKIYHYEPVVQTTDLSAYSFSFNETAIAPSGTIIVLAQHNKYTKDYYINQRFVIGYDAVYKVVNIIKTASLTTYDPMDVGVMQVYLEMDSKSDLDNFETRIAYNGEENDSVVAPPAPPVDDPTEKGVEWQLRMAAPIPLPTELFSTPIEFSVYLYRNNEATDTQILVETSLDKTDYGDTYYEISGLDAENYTTDNTFTLRRLKVYTKAELVVKCSVPADESPTGEEFAYEFALSLRGLE